MLTAVETQAQRPNAAENPLRGARTKWKLLLLLPYCGLCFPQVYTRATPALLGMPFFYWYQFIWVGITAALLAAVYRKLRY